MKRDMLTFPFALLSNVLLFLQKSGEKPDFTDEESFLIISLFKIMIADRMSELCHEEGIDGIDLTNMAENSKEELDNFIKTYTGMDVKEYVKQKNIEYNEIIKLEKQMKNN